MLPCRVSDGLSTNTLRYVLRPFMAVAICSPIKFNSLTSWRLSIKGSHMARLNSILDNDFYKFTMQFAVSKMFPRAQARYEFINRGQHQFPEGFDDRLRTAINELAKLKLTKAEKEFLRIKCPYMDPTYLDFLAGYRYDPDEVQVQQSGGEL